MNEEEEFQQITSRLKNLRPATAEIDLRTVFYQAGYHARNSQSGSSKRLRLGSLAAAGIMFAVLSASAGFFAGRSTIERPLDFYELANVVDKTNAETSAQKDQHEESFSSTHGRVARSAVTSKSRDRMPLFASDHSSLISRHLTTNDWLAFSDPIALSVNRFAVPDVSSISSIPTPILAAGDSRQFLQFLEMMK